MAFEGREHETNTWTKLMAPGVFKSCDRPKYGTENTLNNSHISSEILSLGSKRPAKKRVPGTISHKDFLDNLVFECNLSLSGRLRAYTHLLRYS